MTHRVDLEQDGGLRRWVCGCGWATPWTPYTDAAAGAAAVRHQIDHHREEGPQ